jgi:predicted nucleic acid-binding protein
MKRAFIDANVILRYLTKDPPDMAEASLQTFSAAQGGQIRLILTPITVAEVVWVLESFYDYPKDQIATTITHFLHSEGLEVMNLDMLLQALSLYHEKNIDFADALLAASALRLGPNFIYSFDRHFGRIPGIKRLEPGESLKNFDNVLDYIE